MGYPTPQAPGRRTGPPRWRDGDWKFLRFGVVARATVLSQELGTVLSQELATVVALRFGRVSLCARWADGPMGRWGRDGLGVGVGVLVCCA